MTAMIAICQSNEIVTGLDMAETAENTETALTQIAVPIDLKQRIAAQAKLDLRGYKGEILVLLDEACTAREKRK